jgi:FlaG/FlaF family flagellin (archaellin)
MHYLKRMMRKKGEGAVSPVVGVMLMLVVTIIIAAVVSAFAGTLVTGTGKAPTANVEIHIANGGYNSTSYFMMKVLGVDNPIPTKNLKIVTAWTTINTASGLSFAGGNTTLAGLASATAGDTSGITSFSVPTGYGAGVNGWSTSLSHAPAAEWGNFTLTSGTTTSDSPSTDYGNTTQYMYDTSHSGIDPMQAILGGQWYNLRPGDVVAVRIIDIPSGKEIVDQKVTVEP